MWHCWWNVEKTQVMLTRPTLWHHKEIVWVQINLHTICKKCNHKLHITTKPHATNNTTLFDVLSIESNSVINQSLIEIGIQYADNISKISSNDSQKFKQDTSTMLKKWDLHINKGTTEEFTINRYNNGWYRCKILWSLFNNSECVRWGPIDFFQLTTNH